MTCPTPRGDVPIMPMCFTGERRAGGDVHLRACENPRVVSVSVRVWVCSRAPARARRGRSGGTYLPSAHLPAAALAVYPAEAPLWRYSMVSSDDTQHRRLRAPMARAFAARRVHALRPTITADAGALLAGLFEAGESTADLFRRFAQPLPSRTIARFFGLPVEEAARFLAAQTWGDADALILGDDGIPSLVGWLLARERRVDDARMTELLEPHRPHRYRVVRLAFLSGQRPPRRHPRGARHDIRQH